MNGPNASSTNGFSTRNPTIVALYQSGASPRKLRVTALKNSRTMRVTSSSGVISVVVGPQCANGPPTPACSPRRRYRRDCSVTATAGEDDRHAGAEQHGERALVGDLGQPGERELVHEQRNGEADAAERAHDGEVAETERRAALRSRHEPAEGAHDGDADELADGQADEDAPERRVEFARAHLRHGDHRRRECEQRQDDAVRPRLERVRRATAGSPGHHEAERHAGDSSRARPTGRRSTRRARRAR